MAPLMFGMYIKAGRQCSGSPRLSYVFVRCQGASYILLPSFMPLILCFIAESSLYMHVVCTHPDQETFNFSYYYTCIQQIH